jgi:hypothetical protein
MFLVNLLLFLLQRIFFCMCESIMSNHIGGLGLGVHIRELDRVTERHEPMMEVGNKGWMPVVGI